VYVLAKDCGDGMEFASLPAIERYMEPIDIASLEYEARELTVRRLKLAIRESGETGCVGVDGKVTNQQDFAGLKAKIERRGIAPKEPAENCQAFDGWTADGGCPHVGL
jgi:hypothetical protein